MAKTENSFSRAWLWQEGHWVTSLPRTSVSNVWEQFWQRNSYIGMVATSLKATSEALVNTAFWVVTRARVASGLAAAHLRA
jgi:hypothetical protein